MDEELILAKFVNMTGQELVLQHAGHQITFPKSEQLAYLRAGTEEAVDALGLPCVHNVDGQVYIPQANPIEYQGEKATPLYYIVSKEVLNAAMIHNHALKFWLLAPDLGPTAIYNVRGNLVAFTRFIRA